MQPNGDLTNEKLANKYSSMFDLVAHAIKIARYTVKSGRDPVVRSAIRNPAFITLKEIEEGKDQAVIEKMAEAPIRAVEKKAEDQQEA